MRRRSIVDNIQIWDSWTGPLYKSQVGTWLIPIDPSGISDEISWFFSELHTCISSFSSDCCGLKRSLNQIMFAKLTLRGAARCHSFQYYSCDCWSWVTLRRELINVARSCWNCVSERIAVADPHCRVPWSPLLRPKSSAVMECWQVEEKTQFYWVVWEIPWKS